MYPQMEHCACGPNGSLWHHNFTYHHSALLWHHHTLLHRCTLFYCDIRSATFKNTCSYAITMGHCDNTIGLHWSPLLSENTASWLNHGALWCHSRAFWYHIEFVMSQCSLCWHNKACDVTMDHCDGPTKLWGHSEPLRPYSWTLLSKLEHWCHSGA